MVSGASGATARLNRRLVTLSVCVSLIGVLLFFQLRELDREALRGEDIALRVVLNEIQAQLIIKAAEIRLTGNAQALLELRGGNPVLWMKTPPLRYSGVCPPEPNEGTWCFEEGAYGGQLRYMPINAQALDFPPEGARWQVELDYVDRNRNGLWEEPEPLKGLRLQRVKP